MTLPNDKVLSLLRDEFVVGWKNIQNEAFVGSSHGYSKKQTAVGTTNGAGARNVQIFVLAPDQTVLHALPGFWHPDDLADELRFAQVVWRLYRDGNRSPGAKETMYRRLHKSALKRQSELTTARSQWQGFDQRAEMRRAQNEWRDTVEYVGEAVKGRRRARIKPVNVIVHERMARRPFVKFAEFDVGSFADYGIEHYDNNRFVDKGGKNFPTGGKQRAQRKLEREKRKKARS